MGGAKDMTTMLLGAFVRVNLPDAEIEREYYGNRSVTNGMQGQIVHLWEVKEPSVVDVRDVRCVVAFEQVTEVLPVGHLVVTKLP